VKTKRIIVAAAAAAATMMRLVFTFWVLLTKQSGVLLEQEDGG